MFVNQSGVSDSSISTRSTSMASMDTNTSTDTNMEIVNEANDKERKWWLGKDSLGYLGVDEER